MNFIKCFFVTLLIFASVSLSARTAKSFSFSKSANWTVVLSDKSVNPSSIFNLKDNVLYVNKGCAGYIRSNKQYANYTLKLEWRWLAAKGNSGVLLHIQKVDSVWPRCFQVQQKMDSAGDIICMNGLWANECTDKVKFTVAKMNQSSEKPIGEWNSMEVLSKNGTLTVYINGELQNKVTGLTKSKGFIGFQAEGQAIEYRNLVLEK